jgi:hypothetical protein
MERLILDINKINKKFIYLNKPTFNQIGIECDHVMLHFGALTKKLEVIIDQSLKDGEIKIPQKLTNHVSIPKLPYDHYWEGNHLFLGPVIGMHVNKKYIEKPQKRKRQLYRFSNYSKNKGLIFLFESKFIDRDNKTIKGYYYHPETKSFIEGTFPYPSAIFNRTSLKKGLYEHFKKHIGEKIFNYPRRRINKLNFWLEMSKQPLIKEHLPETKRYENVNGLLKELKKYNAVYLKPTNLLGGKGIFRIEKSDNGYLWSDTHGKKLLIKSRERLINTLKKNLMKGKSYIIQEEIPFFNKQKKIDFRIYLQKDYTKQWRYSGMETRISPGIVTNWEKRKKTISGEAGLKEFFRLNEDQIKKKIDEITRLCITVLNVMEETGKKLGDVAFDLIIDKNKKVWLLEVAIVYGAEYKVVKSFGEQRIVPFILPTPFEYAKALSGFQDNANTIESFQSV